MFGVTSSPHISRREQDSSLNSGNEGERYSASTSNLQANEARCRNHPVLFGLNVYYEEPIGVDPWGVRNSTAAALGIGGMLRTYASVYHSFDARRYFGDKNYDHELDINGNRPTTNCFSETGETSFDVKFTEDRIHVPRFIELKTLRLGAKAGFRGFAFLQNRTGLNMTFFIKPSSPLIHVKESVDWLLPNESFKVHFKSYTYWKEIRNEFILVYAAPIFFPEQLDLLKLRQYWKGLGSDLLPLEHVECHRIHKLRLSPELEGNYSVMDHVTFDSTFSASSLVQCHPCSVIAQHPSYGDFWNFKDEDMEVALACHLREAKRALRRKLQKSIVSRSWNSILLTGLVILLFTAVTVNYCFNLAQLPADQDWKSSLEEALLETLPHPMEAIIQPIEEAPAPPPPPIPAQDYVYTYFVPEPEERLPLDHEVVYGDPTADPEDPPEELCAEPDPVKLGFGSCNFFSSDFPRWNLYIVVNCFWAKLWDAVVEMF